MNWQNIFYVLPGIIIGLTVHEYCHALAASKLGDQTARDMGRLSINPIKHIDPIGLLFIIIAGFGWAKPVQFNPENLRSPRRDKAIIAAAGPISNMLLALLLIALVKTWQALHDVTSSEAVLSFFYSGAFINVINVIFRAAAINLGLFIFNLIPVPPLDGSHIIFSGLNIKPETESIIMKIGAPLLIVIMLIQNHSGVTIIPIGKLISGMLGLFF